ncbi:unnamed protein product [Ectocarpus sp. CCAP 1310/34]|nr:unnamed protein product [Ectocarpus sp. CCAP 1310/34]
MLMEAGAPLEVATKQQLCTPLHVAAVNGCAASTRTMLKAGANPNSRRFDGASRYFWRRGKGRWMRTSLPFDVAVDLGHLEVVNELIRQVGIGGCGGSSGGVRALQQAARNKPLDMLTVLTSAGVVDTGLALRAAAFGGVAPLKFLLEQARARKTMGGPADAAPELCGCLSKPERTRHPRFQSTAYLVRTTSHPCMGLTMLLLRDLGTEPLTEEQLNALEAIRRLLLRVEAVHAVSWLWSSDISTFTYSTAQGTGRTTSKSTPGTPLVLTMRQRARSRRELEVLLAALLRWDVVT